MREGEFILSDYERLQGYTFVSVKVAERPVSTWRDYPIAGFYPPDNPNTAERAYVSNPATKPELAFRPNVHTVNGATGPEFEIVLGDTAKLIR
ncbi:MAG: hypothetical protein Q7T54_04340 [Candidatus Levybacteria bacterium]|nr:hypothetical protein [Candidatus Levybacteria bacterium]